VSEALFVEDTLKLLDDEDTQTDESVDYLEMV
jgi:hypothetical protein